MIETVCENCGKVFQARNKNRRFCSDKCRERNRRVGIPVTPEGRCPGLSAEAEQVAAAVTGARCASNTLAQLSATAPFPLRPGCARISHAITDAIDAEGW